MDNIPAAAQTDFEREKWEAELDLRRRELDLKEREEARLASESRRSRWWNPLFIAIVGATIAALGSVFVTWLNGTSSEETETIKAESARILEAIKANDTEKAKQNLRFLLATGLISEPTASKIKTYLDHQPAGQGPSLPTAGLAGAIAEYKDAVALAMQNPSRVYLSHVTGRLAHALMNEQKYAEAAAAFRQALEEDQNNDDAQFALGEISENGQGVSQSVADAIKYYRLAAKQGNKAAQDALRRLGQSAE